MSRRRKSTATHRPMFLVALSASGKGQAACLDQHGIAETFRGENARRKIVRVPGPEMSKLMGFKESRR